jgi:hypothetical protein
MDQFLFMAAIDPGYIIAGLFLAGLSIYYGLQIRHHRRMEKLAGEIFKLKDLREELAALKQAPVKMEIEPIQGALEEIRGILQRLEQQMELQSHEAPEERPDDTEMGLGRRIEMRLENQGFQKVSIVGDMTGAEEDVEGEYRLSLEAYRDGVAHKGYVTVSGGRIVEEMVKPAYEAFP